MNHHLIIIFNSFLGISNNSSTNFGQMHSNLPANDNIMKNIFKEKQTDNILQVLILLYFVFFLVKVVVTA